MAFKIGQRVVCIKKGAWTPICWGETCPVQGGIYTIRGFDTTLAGSVGLFFEEIVNEPQHYAQGFLEASFCVTRFRPVVETKTDTGMAILKKVAADQSAKRVLVIAND